MKTIELTRDKVAIVDDWNFEWLNQFKWSAHRDPKNERWYAVRTIQSSSGKRTRQFMHRVIMGEPKGMDIDHKDRSPEGALDNRESNLRVATRSQNASNECLRSHNTSGFKGVTWHKASAKWAAQIMANYKNVYLGLFNTAVEAAAVYNFAARRLHGEFAVLNDLSQV